MPRVSFDNNLSAYMLIPLEVVDKFINTASHADLKVLLFLIRNSAVSLDESEICRSLEIDNEQLNKSINFWIKNGVWQKRAGRLSFAFRGGSFNTDEMPAYSGETIALRAQNDEKLSLLLSEAQKRLSKILSPSDISVLYGMYDWLGLPVDVILMLIEYCVSSGRSGMRSIEKCAVSWAEEGIFTYEKAEEKIRYMQMRSSLEGKVAAIMGIQNQARSKKQKNLIEKWTIKYKMSLELIEEAYENMVDRIGKISFEYMDKIITSWHEKGYKTVEDTKNEKAPPRKTRRPKGDNTSYDLDDFFKPAWKISE